jgi:hypothetical protein
MFTMSINEINWYLSLLDLPNLLDIEKMLLEEIRDFIDVFSLKEADKLLLHYLYNYNICLLEGKVPLFGLLYLMS